MHLSDVSIEQSKISSDGLRTGLYVVIADDCSFSANIPMENAKRPKCCTSRQISTTAMDSDTADQKAATAGGTSGGL